MAECFIYGQSGGNDNNGFPNLYNVSFYDLPVETWVNCTAQHKYIYTTTYLPSLLTAQSWKICVHFKCNDISYQNSQALFGSGSGNLYSFPTIEIQSGGTLWVASGATDNSYCKWKHTATFENIINNNDEYYVVFYWNNDNPNIANIELRNITTGVTDVYNMDVSGTAMTPPNQRVMFGGRGVNAYLYSKTTSICLIDTYIEIDGQLVFGNKTNM